MIIIYRFGSDAGKGQGSTCLVSLNDDNVDKGAKRLPDKSDLMIAYNFLSGQAPTINKHLSLDIPKIERVGEKLSSQI